MILDVLSDFKFEEKNVLSDSSKEVIGTVEDGHFQLFGLTGFVQRTVRTDRQLKALYFSF